MGRTIRDYENSGKLAEIIHKSHKFEAYAHVENLRWIPITEGLPMEGQLVIACKSNDYIAWNEVVHYADGMFFANDWSWASEADRFDAWMPMPMPMKWRENK